MTLGISRWIPTTAAVIFESSVRASCTVDVVEVVCVYVPKERASERERERARERESEWRLLSVMGRSYGLFKDFS